MERILKYGVLAMAAIVCILLLVQDGPIDGGLISGFSNRRLNLFKETKSRGSARTLGIVTHIMVYAFMALTLVATLLER